MKSFITRYSILVLMFYASPALALEYFWVGGSGMWSDHNNHWATSSGGAVFHDQVPTSMDNVYFDGNSFPAGGTVTIDQTIIYCMDMDWTGATSGAVLSGPVDRQVFIYGSLMLVAEMEWDVLGEVHFRAFEQGKTIFTAGQVFQKNIYFEGEGGEWILQDELTVTNEGYVFFSSGTFRTNNQNMNIGAIYSGCSFNQKAIYLGTSIVNVTLHDGGIVLCTTEANQIFDAGTSTIIFQGNTQGYISSSHSTFYDVIFRGQKGYIYNNGQRFHSVVFEKNGVIENSNTFENLTFSPGYTYRLGGDQTIMPGGELNASGADCSNFVTILSKTEGEQAGIINASASVDLSYVILRDISGFGGAVFSAASSIDLGNNSGWSITPITPRILYWVNGTGNWNDPNHWSLSSGGVGGECIPTPYDDLFFDANSGLITGSVVQADNAISYCHDIVWTDILESPQFASNSSNNMLYVFGSMILSPMMNYAYAGEVHFMATTLGETIFTAGQVFQKNIYFEGEGGEWILQDELTVTNEGYVFFSSGTFRTNNQNMNIGAIYSGCSFNQKAIYLGTSIVNITLNDGGIVLCTTEANQIFDAGTSTIIFQGNTQGYISSSHSTFYDVIFKGQKGYIYNNGQTFHSVVFEKNGVIENSNTFENLTFSPGYTYTLSSNSIQTISPLGTFTAAGYGGFPIEIKSTQLGQQATLHKDGDPICLDYLYLTDIAATGTGFSYAGSNSDDVFNNDGWLFQACPPCVSGPPLPAPSLDPISITTVQCSGDGRLVLANLSPDFEAVWFDSLRTVELYASTANLFEPSVTQNTTFYGAIRELSTGCLSELLEIQVAVVDIPPVAVCQNLLVNLDPGACSANIVASDIDNGSFDDCGIASLSVFPSVFIPIGTSTVTLSVTDIAGYTSTCTALVTVLGFSNAITSLVCKELVSVVMSNTCSACLGADVALIGGPYRCYDDYIVEIDRTAPFGNGPWVTACFSNVDIEKLYQFRVTDPQTGNKCWGNVEIQDTILPVCLPPASITIPCENFDPTLMVYAAQINDNCCLDPTKVYQGQAGLIHEANYSLFDTVCNKGTLTRTFTAFDCGGNSASCTQKIVVTSQQDYFVKFPDDAIVSDCNLTGIYGEPSFYGNSCELLGINYEDEIFTVLPDACFKIERNWTILNWCTYNSNLDCINIPNPTPNPISNHPSNLVGPIVSACGTPAPWAPTLVRINPTDPAPTNFCTFWELNANCYQYKQVIKIVDNVPPVVVCPPSIEINLDVFGGDTLTLQDINFSYSDDCIGNSELTVLPFSTLFFSCDDQGSTQQVSISVQDICGNIGSCEIDIAVQPNPSCSATISISDPCLCKNNASTLSDGQFDETIKIISTSGLTWTLVANSGLYSTSSPNPPDTPILIPVGTVFTETPNFSGEYFLNGLHVDSLGYFITVESETGEILSIGNQCQYPNPVITSNFSGVFCTFSDAVPLTGISGDDQISGQEFTINGIPDTLFNPSLGPGIFQILYTVNGGTPKEFGPNDPGCIASSAPITIEVIAPILICPDNITVEAEPTLCSAVVNNLMPITNVDICPAALTYRIDGIFGLNFGDASGTTFNVGNNTLNYWLGDNPSTAIGCSVSITVLDVENPILSCISPTVLSNTPGTCIGQILNDAANPVVTDNCAVISTLSHNFAPAPNNNTLAGANFPVGTTEVIWQATDGAGNQGTCQQQITVNDTEAPSILNCPTQMIMVANAPDQCSGKINWTPPAAIDNCGIPVVMQIGGPLSGSIVPVTCPPTPTLITYQATDGSSNSSICSFQIMVIETEAPAFDADIVMPGDVLVDCNAVPNNLVYHGLILGPLTNNDVHDNCSTSANLQVSFSETSTQNPNPALCSHYSYALSRVWTVSDCAGNTLMHTQQITVQDTTNPTAICKSDTIILDDFGTASLLPEDLNQASWDNCAGSYLTYSASQTLFSCFDVPNSPVAVTLTVTDPCGNFSTCQVFVTIWEGNVKCVPEYDLEGSDPCACLNNASNSDNGQFSELIQIQALGGQTWSLVSGTGLYLPSSPAPPANPNLVPNGTILTSGQFDGLDNDGDSFTDEGDERVYYTLAGRHIDGQGYAALLRNNLNQEILLENKCYYPNPFFADFVLNDPLCLGTPSFPITVDEYQHAAGSVVPGSVMINGVATTDFDAAALGIGNHTVMATFDAGEAQPFTKVNGLVVAGSEAEALADPGCRQKITKIVNVVETPTTLICNDLVYVSMDADCNISAKVDDVLEGTYYCYDDYLLQVDKTLPLGNGPWVEALFDASDIGKTYQYRVLRDNGGPNACWGEIKIEDKLAPGLTCPADITVACSESTEVSHTGNIGVIECSNYSVVVDDESDDLGQCVSPRGEIVRTWIVTDAWGNQAACSQTITISGFDLSHIIWPVDALVDCEVTYLNPAGIASVNTGEPSINGASIVGSVWCGAQVGFNDTYFYGCGGTFTILREWAVLNNCAPLGAGNPIVHVQKIQVIDLGGPQFVCPPAVTVSTDPLNCCATAALPDMIVSEGCSDIVDLEAKVTGNNPNNGNVITFTVPGHLEDFAGNNYWNPDTLAVFDYTQCLPVGEYNVRYKASDNCGNTSYCSFKMTVADLVPPVAACDQTTTVAIGGDDLFDCYTPADGCDFAGVTWVKATTFNDGSFDNCNALKYTVRRMNPYSACIDGLSKDKNCYPNEVSEFDLATAELDSIKFYCCEVGTTQTVVLAVYQVDVNGNVMVNASGEPIKNECMIQVEVQDKLKPACLPPAQVAVNCENFDPSLWAYGKATVSDNCCLDTSKVYQGQCGLSHSVNYALFDTVCNKGTITRTFRAYDCHGLSSSCTQRVIVTYEQDYFVKFPNDAIVTVCDGTGNYGEPTFFGEDCELMGVTFADEIFTVVPDACFEIQRTWQIINWCTFNPNQPFIDVPNPNPNAISNAPQNLPGPTVSACGTLPPWKSTIVKIYPIDPLLGTDYCTFWDKEANGYRYKQTIKITDTQAPTGTYTTPTCDNQNWNTANNGALWNEMHWWDNGLQIHDLCEEPTDLCITGTDACSGSNVNIEYLLFLDLDNDGTMETVINSVNTGIAGLGWNNVQYGNASNPNFNGGTPSAFDARPVPANLKYGFTIQETVVGTNKTACVRWNTQQQQNTYVTPELPNGTHKIKWFITDGCGNNKEYEYSFTVKDCKAPTVVCLNGLSTNIMPTGMIQLWANDFLQYTEDNCTPAAQIKTGIRKCGTGTGFPLDAQGNPITNVNFTCAELGTQCVELWAIDAAGNEDYCETYVIVQDNLGNCPTADKINVMGALKTEMLDGVEEGTVSIMGSSALIPAFAHFDLTDSTGVYAVTNAVPMASTFVIAPEKDDNPLNGVTTYDLVLISKHILGLEPLSTPYKMIAADANKSGSITTFDIVEIRKLILGIYTELPNNTSWRFVDKAFTFPNLNNPFQTLFPETISVADAMTTQAGEDFVGVKIGDVNSTVVANASMQTEERTMGTAIFDLSSTHGLSPNEAGSGDRQLKAGEEFEVTFKSAQALKGFQFTLTLNGLKAISTVNTDQVNEGNFNLAPANAMTVSIDGAQGFTVKFRAEKAGKLSEMLGVSGAITRAEAYGDAGRLNVAFRFDGKTIAGVGFELYQNQPNPFVNKTNIGFYLPEAAEAILSVFDESGRVVYQEKGQFEKGENMIALDRSLLNTNGLLYYRLETATDSATRKMIQAK